MLLNRKKNCFIKKYQNYDFLTHKRTNFQKVSKVEYQKVQKYMPNSQS